MDKLEEAIARLERAVARLEAAEAARTEISSDSTRGADNPQLRELAGEIAARVDTAVAKISRVLRRDS
jgi:hypothetical protein